MSEIQNKTKKRIKNKINNCLFCNKEFAHHSWDTQKCCSKKCYVDYLKSLRPINFCATCGRKILTTKYRATRSNLYYCNRDCYNLRRKENLKRLKRSTLFYDDLLNNTSCGCGISQYYLLQIHHKDGVHSNNNPNNLEVVCANCHVKRHLKLNKNNKYVYHPKSLTNIKLVDVLIDKCDEKK